MLVTEDVTIEKTEIDKKNNQLIITLHAQYSSFMQEYKLSVIQSVITDRSRGLDESKKVFTKIIKITDTGTLIETINLDKLAVYTYQGHHISMTTELEIAPHSGSFSFLKSSSKKNIQLGFVSNVHNTKNKAKLIIDPPDKFNVIKNLKVLSDENKISFIATSLIAVAILLFNSWLGIHDENVAPNETFFYSQYNSDNEQQSPLIFALSINVVLAGAFWFLMRNILRQYMTFRLTNPSGTIKPKQSYHLNKLISGIPRVRLNDCELRVIACNIEHGQYMSGTGKDTRIHKIIEPVKCISLFQLKLPPIPKHVDLRDYLYQQLCFDKVYQDLAPNCMIKSTHGLKLHWEIQFIHPEFVDQELIGSVDGFHFGHFLIDKNKTKY